MNRYRTGMESTPEYQLEKTSQEWVLSKASLQRFLDLELALVVLSRELTELGDISRDITGAIRKLRLQQQDMD